MSETATDCAHCGGAAAAASANGAKSLESIKSRREFLTASAASAVAAILVSACGGAGTDAAVVTGPVSLQVQVSDYPALANVGGIAQINGSRTPIAVVRTGADTFAALSLICPHRGCTVGITGSSFRCPCHGAMFSSTGAWTGGQGTSSLTSLTASYDSSTGVLTIGN